MCVKLTQKHYVFHYFTILDVLLQRGNESNLFFLENEVSVPFSKEGMHIP